MSEFKVIVVDRAAALSQRLLALFQDKSITVTREVNLDRVGDRLEREFFDLVVVEGALFRDEDVQGVEVLDVLARTSPATQVLLLAQQCDFAGAEAVLRPDSYRQAELPISDERLRGFIAEAIEKRPNLGDAAHGAGPSSPAVVQLEQLIGRCQPMQQLYQQVSQAVATDVPVLLLGETGTGKDLIAQAIHTQSARAAKPYIPVNLGALPTELVASELFGHEKGAFTGAFERRIGQFEQGHGGTIFLDEINAINEKIQVSLLRLLEQKRFYRLGGRKVVKTDVRIIAASNEDLAQSVRQGSFREDLYYRLDVFPISVPPLRRRQGDVPLLVGEFLRRYNQELHKDIRGLAPETIALLEAYHWPGNVRELKNVLQRAVLVCEGQILTPEDLPARFHRQSLRRPMIQVEVGSSLAEIERESIARTLAHTGNNRKRAAEVLGISRRALYNKMSRLHIS